MTSASAAASSASHAQSWIIGYANRFETRTFAGRKTYLIHASGGHEKTAMLDQDACIKFVLIIFILHFASQKTDKEKIIF